MDDRSRFDSNVDACQAQRDSEVTEVNAMRQTNQQFGPRHSKGTARACVTDLATVLRWSAGISNSE